MLESLEIAIEPRSGDYDPGDSRWLDAVDELKQEVTAALRGQEGDLVERGRPVAGTKGELEDLILVLGSSGAITAAVTAFKAWLASGRNREIVLRRREDDHVTEVSVRGVGVTEKELIAQLQAVMGASHAAR
ncbi:MAG TPA: hypothetical protein VK841_22770 [Polyangiaceae bacterium]|jgi:hypothetical protein|nr:hypothetical protein [Polyangiaceae bacterium]